MGGVSGPYPLGLGRPAHPGGTLEDSRVPCDTRSAAESRATDEENSPHLMERKSVRSLGKDSHDPRYHAARDGRHDRLVERRGEAQGPLPRARLSTAPDSVWKNEFARISHMTDGLESEPGWANVPDFDVLTVGGIEVGTEAVVRKHLDAMMRQTNAAATRARKERDEIAYARQQAVKAQEESAKQMTERFRSPG